jgi:uncharacterized protein YueI
MSGLYPFKGNKRKEELQHQLLLAFHQIQAEYRKLLRKDKKRSTNLHEHPLFLSFSFLFFNYYFFVSVIQKIKVPIRIQENEKAYVPFILQLTCLET